MRQSLAKIVVTGADGFVGSNLLERMPRASGVDRSKHDFFQLGSLKELFSGAEAIIHLAGVNAGTVSIPSPASMVHGNLDLTAQLIRAIRLYCPNKPRVIFLSSIHVYEPIHPLTEESTIGPVASYGMTKYGQELLLQQAAESGLIELITFRATHIYGPYTQPFYNSGVATMCHQALHDAPIDLYGNGKAELDLLYVGDLITYLERALTAPLSQAHETMNIASGQVVTVEHVVDTIEAAVGKKLQRKLIDTPVKPCSISAKKLTQFLGNIKMTPLAIGIQTQIQQAHPLSSE